MSLTNVYHVRRVADTSAKACLICYKPSTSVMITPDNKDFFYVCPAHLQDKNFCSPIVDTEGQAKRLKEEEMAKEIEKIKKEYEEKQRRKKEREKASNKDNKEEKDKGKDKPKDEDKAASDSNAKDEKDRDDKIASIQKGSGTETKSDDSPRIFSLHKNFYQMRIDRLRSIEMTKRNQERLRQPSLFPSVPSGNP
ncbi:hypothetical protein DTO013E5_9054 [Penicillium roqueforti]|uniref:DUF1742-domain-containing protein n=1 Tax=Penicillium roqueforti (strain FM164) TaxID=1365484 RepID=W6QE68_PENRF|nr:uncharacterized protein LCP9604111_7184 [Penicillium roqueforti]CDM27882.1 Protein of unknown function DUF1742, fungi [Penicillium roqueforti FM164]KAF9244792.1 hypothetical protein LCP9604111_7184 [Penicillium roqueforti]KAI1831188.1 hypothetical protein CBS147337_7946 [Penicillium roqueforti]KAI2680933.1 hypothetical protein LCP963914a_6884 [Penicillium roqueforti]KAI2690586.1 hypothetical protein CBS147355_1037 [Penicillium roqueforti]